MAWIKVSSLSSIWALIAAVKGVFYAKDFDIEVFDTQGWDEQAEVTSTWTKEAPQA